MKKRIISLLVCFCITISLFSMMASAAGSGTWIEAVDYHKNGDVKRINVNLGCDMSLSGKWISVMRKPLRSAGSEGTDKTYGDFTAFGYYGKSFKSWAEVVINSKTFGMFYYTKELILNDEKRNEHTFYFNEGEIPLDVDGTYYFYLWESSNGYYYPESLFMVLEVKNGILHFALPCERNKHGSFLEFNGGAATVSKFRDVKKDDYFHDAVIWAVENGITNGTSESSFSPNERCTRGQMLTFLWRAAGSPENINGFTMANASDYFYDAALWAEEKGIYDSSSYLALADRAFAVKSLRRFADVSSIEDEETLEATVLWAVENGITNGTSETEFSPRKFCTRAEVITFLYRYFASPLDSGELGVKFSDLEEETEEGQVKMPLDPNPPEDKKKLRAWYESLTPVEKMSDERLAAELDNILDMITVRTAWHRVISDYITLRYNDLMNELIERSGMFIDE